MCPLRGHGRGAWATRAAAHHARHAATRTVAPQAAKNLAPSGFDPETYGLWAHRIRSHTHNNYALTIPLIAFSGRDVDVCDWHPTPPHHLEKIAMVLRLHRCATATIVTRYHPPRRHQVDKT